jgi:hypothetical protein
MAAKQLGRPRILLERMSNVYFDLTEEFNADAVIALLASGQAVVFYRIALMSKDGDWVLRETESACRRVRNVLAARGARYRPCAPLDPRWLAGGWSSHFEFFDAQRRRVRCDFVSRPPRILSATSGPPAPTSQHFAPPCRPRQPWTRRTRSRSAWPSGCCR